MKHLMSAIMAILVAFITIPVTSIAAEDPFTILITASRSPETVNESLASVTILDQERIRQSGDQNVGQILSRVPGISVSNSGGSGKQTSIFLRGTESDHVLVLIDGVKVGSATLGSTPFQDIPLSMVEKIEIVRGPRSSLYGSEAIGGVIQIFTHSGKRDTRSEFSSALGSHNSYQAQAGISSGNESGWFNLSLSTFTTDGFDACKGNTDSGCYTDEPDDDGYKNRSFSLRGNKQLNDRLSLATGLFSSSSEVEFDGTFYNGGESSSRTFYANVEYLVSGYLKTRFQVAESRDYSDNFLNDVFKSSFNTQRQQLSWISDITSSNLRITAGVDYVDDEVDSTTQYDELSRDNIGYFSIFNTVVSDFDFEASLRYDDNQQFGGRTTGGLAVGRDVGQSHRLTASYGTAFKAPTFNELYWPNFGNPDISEETSSSIDIGLSGFTQNRSWAMNVFNTKIEDLIGFNSQFMTVNIDQTKIYGIEFSVSAKLNEWVVDSSLTFQNPEDDSSGPNRGNQLARRAQTMFHIAVSREFENWTTATSLRYQGKSYEAANNLVQLDAFTVVDVKVGTLINPDWEVAMNIYNLFDEDYETVADYNQDSRNYLLTLRYIAN